MIWNTDPGNIAAGTELLYAQVKGPPMKFVSVAATVICTALIFALPRWTSALPDILNLFLGIFTGVVWFIVLLFAMSTLRGTEKKIDS